MERLAKIEHFAARSVPSEGLSQSPPVDRTVCGWNECDCRTQGEGSDTLPVRSIAEDRGGQQCQDHATVGRRFVGGAREDRRGA